MSESEQRRLIETQRRIAELTAALHRAQGEHDKLLRERCDSEGLHDRRQSVR